MPNLLGSENSICLVVIDGGKIDKVYFSPQELLTYSWDREKRPRIDIEKNKMETPMLEDNFLEDVVKRAAKELFLNSKEEVEKTNSFEEDRFNKNDFKEFNSNEKEIKTEFEFLQERLEEYILNEEFGMAAEIKDEIDRKKQDPNTENM